MKKRDFENLLNSNFGFLGINAFCKLTRWTSNALGDKCDCLELSFSLPKAMPSVRIQARDFQQAKQEIATAMKKTLNEFTDEMVRDFLNGYSF